MRTPLLPLLLCLPIVAQEPAPSAPVASIAVGQPAPTFRLNDDAGAATRLGGTSKTWTVLAFYPKASTGG